MFHVEDMLSKKSIFLNRPINRLYGPILHKNTIWKKVKFQIFTTKFYFKEDTL